MTQFVLELYLPYVKKFDKVRDSIKKGETLLKIDECDQVVSKTDEERGYVTQVFGYARVSTEDQNLDLQKQALTEYGCEEIYEEKRSAYGVKRKQLEWLKFSLQAGDTLVVWKLDRLGRSVAELIELMAWFDKRGIEFVSLRDNIDTRTAMGRFMFHLLASLAQLERDLTAERTKAGMDAARKRGWHPGPQTLLQRLEQDDPKKLKALRKDIADPKMSWRKLHEKYGYAVATLRRHFEGERKEALVNLAAEDEK